MQRTVQTDNRLTRNLTLGYIAALSVIATLSIATHFLLNSAMVQNESSATVINIAGRQRMLSQRIDLYAHMLLQGNDRGARAELMHSIELFEQSHNALENGDGRLGLTLKLSPALRQIYFSEPDALNRRSHAFIQAAKTLLNDEDANVRKEAFRTIDDSARGELLSALDKAVNQFEAEATERIRTLERAQLIVLAALLITLTLEALIIFRPLVAKIKSSMALLLQVAMHDGLTNLANRKYFMEAAERELLIAQRYGLPLSLLMIDIDHFKNINDTYGHATGDAVLTNFSEVALQTLRSTDIIGRIGGEEFAVLLPATDMDNAHQVAGKILLAVSAAQFAHQDLTITVSIGLATMNEGDNQMDTIMQRADYALYEAKENGRNQIVIHQESVSI
jgi:diguanylate cyclase (GGDEF)-like protein